MSREDAMAHEQVDTIAAIEHLVTEDETPVDNLPSEKQQRLLTELLYSAWSGPGEGRTFWRQRTWACLRRYATLPSYLICF